MCLVARTEVFSGESANLPGRTKIDLFQQLIDLISALETCFEAKRAPTLQVPAPDTWDIGLIWQDASSTCCFNSGWVCAV